MNSAATPGTGEPKAPAKTLSDWWRTAVVYEVYPRSFRDGDGDGMGDLAGVRAGLPYLQDLGVDALWFTPWYASPMADAGYDVADYRAVDPLFGTLADAEALIAEAAALGIRVIVDVVPNHVSAAHPWFREALAAGPGSPERDRFWFHPGRGEHGDEQPTHWRNNFAGETWTRTTNPDGSPGEWYLHLFDPAQPDLNWTHPDVIAEHEDVLRFWFDRGVAGVRIDSAALIVKDPTFPEEPTGTYPAGTHPNTDRDGIHEIYRGWRAVADSYDPPRMFVGEVWLPDAERFAAYLDDEMHTAFNFDLMSRPWDAAQFRGSIDLMRDAHAGVGAPCTWVLSNHDVTRPVTRYGRTDTGFGFDRKAWGVPTDLALGTRRARAAALLTAALPGSLYLYQGDELGLPEAEDLPREQLQDPMYLRSGGTNPGRDGCRVPLPWSGTAAPYGFSPEGVATWLAQPGDWAPYTAQAQRADPGSMLNLYRAAFALRRSEPGLRGEDFAWVEAPDGVLAFRRGDLVILTNFTATPLPLPDGLTPILTSAAGQAGELPPNATVWTRG